MISRRRLLTQLSAIAAAGAVGGPAAAAGGIQKAVLFSMLPQQMSLLDRFKLAVDVGFKQMEVPTVEDDQQAVKIKEAAGKAGLRIHSVMNQAHWKYPISSPDPAVVETSMKGMEKSLHQAKLYGADAVLLVPAVVAAGTTYEQAWERSQKQIRKLIPLAEKLGVIIAVEEVWNRFLLTARDFAQYVDEFESPMVKAYFDVGNVVHYGVPQQWIRQLGKRIVKVHLKDYKYREREFVNLGDGDVDWPEVAKALREIGYHGVATVELEAGDRAYLADVSRRVDRLLELSG